MKILIIDEEFPYPLNSGKRLRTSNLTYELALTNDVSYLAFGDIASEAAKHFKSKNIQPIAVTPINNKKSGLSFYLKLMTNLFSSEPYIVTSHYSSEFETQLLKLINEQKFDVIICEWTPYAQYVKNITKSKSIIVAHNIESDIWKRYYENESNPLKRFYIGLQYKKVLNFEKNCFKWVDGATAVSSIDASFIKKLNLPYTPAIIENGVDTDFFTPSDTTPLPHRLAFTGSMDWRPNQDAAEFFASEILPLLKKSIPDIEAYFIGRNPPPHIKELNKIDGITITGMVDDVRTYIADGSLYIVPLRIGGGSRLKILEAMGMKKPIISTSVGAEGLEVTDLHDILIADTPQEFCDTILKALKDKALCDKIAKNGFSLVHEKYKWSSIGKKLNKYLSEL